MSKLPFSDDSFKVYSCRASDKDGKVLAEDKVTTLNDKAEMGTWFQAKHSHKGDIHANPSIL